MKRHHFGILFSSFLVGVGVYSVALGKAKPTFQGSVPVSGKKRGEYPAMAKLSLQDAVATAVKTTAGTVTEAALDKENGFLVYEIDVVMPDQSRKELLIDAGDGKVLLTKEQHKRSPADEEEDDED